MKLSVFTTLYRSAGQPPEFHERLSRAAAALEPDYELVLVNALAAALYLMVRRVFFGVLLAGWPSLTQRPHTIVRAVHRGGGGS